MYSLFCAKTLQAYLETCSVNNDIGNIRVHYVEPDLYDIKVGCKFFGTPCMILLYGRISGG